VAFQYASGFNSYVPAATGQVIAYVRDPAKYRVNKYVQLVKTDKSVFVWYKVHRDDVGQRVVTDAEWVWEDGAKRSDHHHNSLRFDLVEGQTIRRHYGFTIGWKAIEQADLKLLVAHTVMARNQRMTNFTKRVVGLLENTASWGGNTATANTLNGGAGQWDLASSDATSPNYLAIKKTLDTVAQKILLATNGSVNWDEEAPKLLISPGLALKMSQSSEIHDYLAQSPYAMAQVKGRTAGQNARWGLPDDLYGWEIEVEDATVVSERPQADGDHALTTGSPAPRRFIKSDDSAVAMTRVGGIDGQMGAPNFSTLQVYYYKAEVQVEVVDEAWDRRTKGSVTEDVVEVLASPDSGYLIQDTLS
jgi:hypothetical protein